MNFTTNDMVNVQYSEELKLMANNFKPDPIKSGYSLCKWISNRKKK